MHYTATFIPALALKGVKFDGQHNQLQQLTTEDNDEDGQDVDKASVASSDNAVPQEVTIKMPKKAPSKPTDANATATSPTSQNFPNTTASSSSKSDSLHTAETNGTSKKETEPGVEMSVEQLVKQRKHPVSSINLFAI